MNKDQEARLSSTKACERILLRPEHRAVYASHAAFSQCVTELSNLILQVGITAEAQISNATSAGTELKSQMLLELVDSAYDVVVAVKAYGVARSDWALVSRVNYARWTIKRGRPGTIKARCESIHKAALENLQNLADYQLDAAKLDVLKERIAAYDAASTKPRENRVAASTATEALPQLFSELSELLNKRMDGLMFHFKDTPLYTEYFNARKIVEPTTISSAETGAAASTTSGTNLPLSKAA